MDIIVQWSQIVMLILMIVGLIYAWIQIRLMQSNEADKKRLAVLSLIQELQYNKKLITEYIDHDVNGANTTPKDGHISYELNKPILIAYEQNAITACGNDEVILKDITCLYEKIDACKVLVEQVLLIVANNEVECKLSNNKANFITIVGKVNLRLSQEAKAANQLIDISIKKLEFLNKNCKELKKMDKKPIKRIIAREGLIIICLLTFYFINNWLGIKVNTTSSSLPAGKSNLVPLCFWGIPDDNPTILSNLNHFWYLITQFSLYIAYPLYWLIRFIIWAVNTLRERK